MNAYDEIQSRLVHGEALSQEDERRLSVAMGVQPGFCEQLDRDQQLAGELSMTGRCERLDDDFVARTLKAWDTMSSVKSETSLHNPLTAVTSTPDWERPMGVTTLNRSKSHRPLVLLSVVASVLIVGGLLLCSRWVGRGPNLNDGRSKMARKSNVPAVPPKRLTSKEQRKGLPPDIPRPNTHEKIVARLTAQQGCRWKSGRSPRAALSSGSLELIAGSATLSFTDGAIVKLTGPARFELQSGSNGYLHHGRLSASVPSQAVGFTIETPIAIIVDLGTEFRVVVEQDGTTQVNVTKGVVEYRDRDEEVTNSKRVRVSEGGSYRVKPLKLKSKGSDSNISSRDALGETSLRGFPASNEDTTNARRLENRLQTNPR